MVRFGRSRSERSTSTTPSSTTRPTTIPLVEGQQTTGIDASFDAYWLGSNLYQNDTRIRLECDALDPRTVSAEVVSLDGPGGTVDFGDGSAPWAFDTVGDCTTDTFPYDGTVTTPTGYLVEVLLDGGAGPGAVDGIGFTPGLTACALPDGQTFPDVPRSHPFFADVEWLAREGITDGLRPMVAPDRLAADAGRQGAAWLYRLAGEPDVDLPQQFPDVPPDHPFYDAIQWMADEGITEGYPDGTFGPGEPMVRQGVAAWLHRYAGEPDVGDAPQQFPDVLPGHPFYDAIQWLSVKGITIGFPDGTYRPGGEMTRQAVAVWLHHVGVFVELP
ncbi:MAG: S-layer homology domain-containing protein [Acidimicrobiia bacterium]|nr:S-layer homology domain-containing protein [Acidimicrobiia bacterium]